MSALEGPPAEPAAIKVYGLLGTFRVGQSSFVVKYVSTFANPTATGQLTGHKELLEELKPMRDRLDASKLKNLNSLLQRDLNDRRVAQDLIPYLLGADMGSASSRRSSLFWSRADIWRRRRMTRATRLRRRTQETHCGRTTAAFGP